MDACCKMIIGLHSKSPEDITKRAQNTYTGYLWPVRHRLKAFLVMREIVNMRIGNVFTQWK